MITIIAAVAADGGIGRRGDLLWHIPADLKHFKKLTMGAPVVMGRNTWESLPKRPLPGRRNIVISRNPSYLAEGAEVYASLADALDSAALTASSHPGGEKEVFIIGGASIYAAALPMADALELTEIDATADDADTFFPEIDFSDWILVRSEPSDIEEKMRYCFRRYERKSLGR